MPFMAIAAVEPGRTGSCGRATAVICESPSLADLLPRVHARTAAATAHATVAADLLLNCIGYRTSQ
jgi:hypothetical protein